MSSVNHKLIEPLKIGTAQLQRRVVLAPLTLQGRHEPRPTLSSGVIILRPAGKQAGDAADHRGDLGGSAQEGTRTLRETGAEIRLRRGKRPRKPCTQKASFIFSQLVALGRAANPPQLQEEDPYISDVQLTGKDNRPRGRSSTHHP
ncbi:hypothetical protein B0H14DRAFT_3448102 [Mycena olivaceomarginata]|nr:hypothetical protein B0H14DRAFT_3448102 [Mycena olivaceomarginata]